MTVQMFAVESSNVDQVGYDPDASELTVRFKSTPRSGYVYSGVSLAEFGSFLAAISKGSYFASRIKSKHAVRQVIESEPTAGESPLFAMTPRAADGMANAVDELRDLGLDL